MSNNNHDLVQALRDAADYLETHPDIPKMTIAWLNAHAWNKEEMLAAARAMGSAKKEFKDDTVRLVHKLGPLEISVEISRDRICKRIVTWDCPDESWLRELTETQS